MNNNGLLDFYNLFLKNDELENVNNVLSNIDNALILCNSSNIMLAKFWSIILNHKYGYITTADSFSMVNDSKLKVYKNIIVLDLETELFIQDKNFNGNKIFINQVLHKIAGDVIKTEQYFILSNIIMGLLIYYEDKTLDVLKNVFYKVESLEINDIDIYNVIVCNGFVECGINLYNHNLKVIPFINFVDQNKQYDNILFLGSFSNEETNIINQMNYSSFDIVSSSFNDEIEQIVYGALFAMSWGR